LTTGATSLAYDDLGPGEPALLLLTGWCSSRRRWSDAAARLARGRRVVSFDWRSHGDSPPVRGDFGLAELVDDALAVIQATRLGTLIPCAASHAGWVAIELRRRLGPRIPAIVHLDWMLTEPPPAYRRLLSELQSPERWPAARESLLKSWRAGDSTPEIAEAIETMRRHEGDMWMRSGREIEAAYRRAGSPLRALSALRPPPRVLHLYGQPAEPEYLQAQQRFAHAHDWFSVRRLATRTHFSMIEAPAEVAAEIEALARPVTPVT